MKDGAGIGRRKELQLDDVVGRYDYVLRQLGEAPGDMVAALLVVADAVRDVERLLRSTTRDAGS